MWGRDAHIFTKGLVPSGRPMNSDKNKTHRCKSARRDRTIAAASPLATPRFPRCTPTTGGLCKVHPARTRGCRCTSRVGHGIDVRFRAKGCETTRREPLHGPAVSLFFNRSRTRSSLKTISLSMRVKDASRPGECVATGPQLEVILGDSQIDGGLVATRGCGAHQWQTVGRRLVQ